ncbi:MAG: response regulator [Xanthobacteraceae bacterium]|nr:response regulator [Xanthobacteraceae bacterium]
MNENGSGARRVLVVEDDVMIRMLIEDMLTDLGFAVAAEASKVHDALAAVQSTDIDVAILDVNLSGETTGPVAAALAARGTPFVFATGYGEHGLPDQFRDRPLLKKPFQIDNLKRMLDTALTGA